MVEVRRFTVAIALLAGLLHASSASALAQQNQSPPRPQPAGQPAGNQSPAAPGNQTASAPQPPAAIPLYISPGIVQQIQKKLLSLGLPVPTVSGAWGDNSSAALRTFQTKNGLDAGGDLDELTLLALGMPEVLRGENVPGADAPVSASAVAAGGAPLYASPRLARVVQNKLSESGFPTDNVFGIWLAGSETAARGFQKSKGMDITGTLDLRILHELGLTSSLTEPKPGKLPTDAAAQVLSDRAAGFAGAPVNIGPAGVRQIQAALQQRGFKEVATDGRWSDQVAAALKKFQESQKLEASGTVNLRTLRALGFNNPLTDVDQAAAAPAKTTK
jgi:peptidoglycan hydrolase-like protein with peptidoglycan-binding domain